MLIRNLLKIYLFAFLGFMSCGKSGGGGGGGGTPNPCTGVTITVGGSSTNLSAPGANDGTISATASGGSGFTFSLNGGTFQSSGSFTGLAAGTYSVTAKDSRGCTGSGSFTITAPDPCASVSFTVGGNTVSATPCVNPANGSITVTTSGGGSGFTYNLNGGAFQANPQFTNLAANTYTVGAREAGGCVRTASVTVSATAAGPMFTTVRTIINSNCTSAGCHSGAAPAGGLNFTQDCQIVANRARIKVRAVDDFGTANQMPPPPQAGLSQSNRDAITNWIAAGGQFNN